jgi:hypothetical protein
VLFRSVNKGRRTGAYRCPSPSLDYPFALEASDNATRG